MAYQDIDPAQLQDLLDSTRLIILDQRDPATRAMGELPGAQSVTDLLIGQLVRRRRASPAVLVYCYHGNQSRELCSFLSQLGLPQVYNLAGGWDALERWRQAHKAATDKGSQPHVSWLEERGFDPQDLNSRIDMGMSALMIASLEGRIELVKKLLALGADPNHINDDYHHALWFACVNGEVDLVSTLIENGADIDNRNVNGVTCAIYAASTGKLEVLKCLVDAGADLELCTHDGYDALDSATTLEVLRYLRRRQKASLAGSFDPVKRQRPNVDHVGPTGP